MSLAPPGAARGRREYARWHPWATANALYHQALLARDQGDLGQAEDLHHAALAARHERGLLPGVVESLEALAALALEHESAAEAARIFAAAAALRERIGLSHWPVEQPAYDAEIDSVRDALGDDFDDMWAEGAALDVDDAVAYTSRARGERKRPRAGWESSTPTEERVVALVAEGLTNPQIADRMFIARGTVKVPLAHVFTKLDVSTRAELAAAVTRRTIGRARD